MIKKFLEAKRYWYFLPRSIRFKIFNLRLLKKYHTSTGIFFLPFFAFKDSIRNSIINDKIFDEKIFYTLEKFRKIDNERSNPSIKKFFQKARDFWKN